MYASVAAPLESLHKMKAIATSNWNAPRGSAFQALKDLISAGTFLSTADFSKPFHVAVDALNRGIGAVFYQMSDSSQPDDISGCVWILLASRSLHSSERNYSATKRELLASVFSLKKFNLTSAKYLIHDVFRS